MRKLQFVCPTNRPKIGLAHFYLLSAGLHTFQAMKQPSFQDLIIFENDDYIVINKPPFLSTLDDRTAHSQNILRLAKAYDPEAQVAHRLDKETSGALAIARNPEAYRHLAMQFAPVRWHCSEPQPAGIGQRRGKNRPGRQASANLLPYAANVPPAHAYGV